MSPLSENAIIALSTASFENSVRDIPGVRMTVRAAIKRETDSRSRKHLEFLLKMLGLLEEVLLGVRGDGEEEMLLGRRDEIMQGLYQRMNEAELVPPD